MRCTDIGRPHHHVGTYIELGGTMELENRFQSTRFTDNLPTTQAYLLLQKLEWM